jgi:hypothetical protein
MKGAVAGVEGRGSSDGRVREKKWKDVLQLAWRDALRASGGVGGHRHAASEGGSRLVSRLSMLFGFWV